MSITNQSVVTESFMQINPCNMSPQVFYKHLDKIQYAPRIHAVTITTSEDKLGTCIDMFYKHMCETYAEFTIISTTAVPTERERKQIVITFSCGKPTK